jgi:hypothetical protein
MGPPTLQTPQSKLNLASAFGSAFEAASLQTKKGPTTNVLAPPPHKAPEEEALLHTTRGLRHPAPHTGGAQMLLPVFVVLHVLRRLLASLPAPLNTRAAQGAARAVRRRGSLG